MSQLCVICAAPTSLPISLCRSHALDEALAVVFGEKSGNAALRAEIADLRNEVEQLQSRVAYLESKRDR